MDNIEPPKDEQLSRTDELKRAINKNRADHVEQIFAIYDQIPQLLADFKEEGVSEDVMVSRLGMLIEKVFNNYELTQLPLIFETIKEKNKAKEDKKIITSADSTKRIIIP